MRKGSITQANYSAVLDNDNLILGVFIKDNGWIVLHHIDVNGGAGRLTVVITVAHCDMTGAPGLFLLLKISVKHAGGIQANADFSDIIAVLDFGNLTADFLTDFGVTADNLNNASFLYLQLDRNRWAAVVTDRSINDQFPIGSANDRAQRNLAVGPCHGITGVAGDAALDNWFHLIHFHI